MRTRLWVGVLVLGVVTAAGTLSAHHAFSAIFDAKQPVNLRGTVTKVELINPHSWIWLDVKSPDGKVVNWGIEGGSPNSLIRHGVTKNTLPVGTEILVYAFRAKDGSNQAVGANLTLTDGRKLFLGSQTPAEAGGN
jgi:hypothetical protein